MSHFISSLLEQMFAAWALCSDSRQEALLGPLLYRPNGTLKEIHGSQFVSCCEQGWNWEVLSQTMALSWVRFLGLLLAAPACHCLWLLTTPRMVVALGILTHSGMFDSGTPGTSVVSDLNPYEQLTWRGCGSEWLLVFPCHGSALWEWEKTEPGGLSLLLGGSFLPCPRFLPHSPFRDFLCCG